MTPVEPPTRTTAEPQRSFGKSRGHIATVGLAIAMTAGLVVLLLAFAGAFKEKVSLKTGTPPEQTAGDRPTVDVQLIHRPRFETAVGTIRAVHESSVASRLLARVVEVNVKAGQKVTRDEILVRLDEADLQARLKQATAAQSSAAAALTRAQADNKRMVEANRSGSVTASELDQSLSALKIATAEAERTQQMVHETRTMLEFATIRSPLTGTIVDKKVEVGDTVTPGQVLLTLFDPTRMQMVTSVRESLASRLKIGNQIPASVEAMNHHCLATVSEIVPESQAASRSFTVKVTGPCPPGVYSGMFGRISIPLDDEEVVVIPTSAVVRVGQLDMVDVVADGVLKRRCVQLGRKLDSHFEVLSGLQPGEKVALQRKANGEKQK